MKHLHLERHNTALYDEAEKERLNLDCETGKYEVWASVSASQSLAAGSDVFCIIGAGTALLESVVDHF